jgi:hypothetical protein
MTEPRNNCGFIAKNTRKNAEKQPDITGKATVGGIEYRVAGWRKTNDKGSYYSLSFKPADDTAQTGPKPPPPDDSGF